MAVERMAHMGIVVDDLAPATAFRAPRAQVGDGPAPANAPGEDIFRLCDVRGPEGIIVELAERIS